MTEEVMGEEADAENTKLYLDRRLNKKPPLAVFCLLKQLYFVIVFSIECVCSSVVERCPDKTEVEGSIPSRHTREFASNPFFAYDVYMNWQPVIVFYVKTTSWIVLPLVVGLIAGNFIKSKVLFFVFLMVSFGVTCFGIYREIRQYKKDLSKNGK